MTTPVRELTESKLPVQVYVLKYGNMHMHRYLSQISSSSSSGLTTTCANVSGEMVQRGEKEPLEAEEMVRDVFTGTHADKRTVRGLQPDSLGIHPGDFCTTWYFVFLKLLATGVL